MHDPLAPFHPVVRQWFRETLGEPTDVQARAWSSIARGEHLLMTAPTGSGKTLAAFLWALDRLLTGVWHRGRVRVLYLSPLKALNNDIRRNLIAPLEALADRFAAAGIAVPSISVMTRSGDTPGDERRLMRRRPPEILITTPESLNILLTGRGGRHLFEGLCTVIIDEIHAVAGTKRGTHLITAVDRLVPICGEFQRVALSATVRPLQLMADFAGGWRMHGEPADAAYEKRPVTIVGSSLVRSYDLRVLRPEVDDAGTGVDGLWASLVRDFKAIVHENRSTLFFANSRRTTEKTARLLNEGEPAILAYSHHGSISRELRLEIEENLKAGRLKAIVATSSLELGIDIGELDEVVLIETPRSVSSCIQRIGRAGHGVGQVSRGRLYPTHGLDLLKAAVMTRAALEQSIEPLAVIDAPLDVLAQVILSMTAPEPWDIDALYAQIRTSYPYRGLSRRHFDLVLEMLAGRYAESRLRELFPRVSIDRLENRVTAREGVPFLLYTSGGTITDTGNFTLRVEQGLSRIGELDEEFVWERRIGDTFAFGTQVWRITRITDRDVEVVPVGERPGIIPFWKAEETNRDFHFSSGIMDFLERMETALDDGAACAATLRGEHAMSAAAAVALVDFLERQREAGKGLLPHRRRVLVEHYRDPANRLDSKQVIIHTFWGGRINRPYALAIAAAWEERYRYPLEVFANDDQILISLPHDFDAGELLALVPPEGIERLLRARLESTGLFGARFRENAARALLLPRGGFNRRFPRWLNRLRSKKLLDAVMRFADFPVLVETWRECLRDDFDLERLGSLLDELRDGTIAVSEIVTAVPSPFCGGIIWRQTNKHMYEDDTPTHGGVSALAEDIMNEVLFSARLRVRVPRVLVRELEEKLQRIAPGYAPGSAGDILDVLKERLLVTPEQWQALIDATMRDSGSDARELEAELAPRIQSVSLRGLAGERVAAREMLPLINRITGSPGSDDAPPPIGEELMTREGFLSQWLSFYGPLERARFHEQLGGALPGVDELIDRLLAERGIVAGILTEGAAGEELCDAENLERLLRMHRRSRQPQVTARPLEELPLYLACWQGLVRPGREIEGLQQMLEQLFGYPAAAADWEERILPARLEPYYPAWLDSLLQSSGLQWFGCGPRELTFAFSEDLPMFMQTDAAALASARALFPDPRGAYGLFDIARHGGLDTGRAAERLWELAWQGIAASSSFEVVRRGIANDFTAMTAGEGGITSARVGRNRWTASRPLAGAWQLLPTNDHEPGREGGRLADQELVKDRVRLLFNRYGILFRELLANELDLLQWRSVLSTLRLMELSGEILSGYFFEGIGGLQFISPEALRFFRGQLPGDACFTLNARDPASLCGVRLEGLRLALPRRVTGTDLFYRGSSLVMVSQRGGRSLSVRVDAADPALGECLGLLMKILGRTVNAPRAIVVESINDEPALTSPYASALRAAGFTGQYKTLELRRSYS